MAFLRWRGNNAQVCLALVHHANQYVITEDYADRDGLRRILGLDVAETCKRGLLPLLEMHLRYEVPLNLHLSGTFIETLAWHCAECFALIEHLGRARLLEMIGSTFSQNVMPFFSEEYNLRQMNEELWLYRRHLAADLNAVKTFWVPERVWDTEKLAGLLRSNRLLNGGYRYVLLDDRLVYPVGDDYRGCRRERFDREAPLELEAFTAYKIKSGRGLVMLPISRKLRYLIPPGGPELFDQLHEIFSWLASSSNERAIAVYGDDLEKAAGVGGWDCLHLERYEQFLRWLSGNSWIKPVLIGSWAGSHSPAGEREIERGAFYELAQLWNAGEDYCRWFEDPDCFEHRQCLIDAERALIEAGMRGAQVELLELGWKHLLHCSYETSWHDAASYEASETGSRTATEQRRLAGWAAALTSHARSCRVIAMAAEWPMKRDGLVHAEIADVDGDGEQEIVLKNDHLFAVFSPVRGGRLTYLFDLTDRSGRLVIGNISDDWNLQEELNRYMDCPRNHPGALAEVGHEHDRYQAILSDALGKAVNLNLCNIETESRLYGTEKRISLAADAGHICVSYLLAPGLWRLSTEVCLSPDYSRLLRCGREGVAAFNGPDWRGWSNGSTRVWARIDPRQSTIWDRPYQVECGHGLNLRVTAFSRDFQLEIGVGLPPRQSHKIENAREVSNWQEAIVRKAQYESAERVRMAVWGPT